MPTLIPIPSVIASAVWAIPVRFPVTLPTRFPENLVEAVMIPERLILDGSLALSNVPNVIAEAFKVSRLPPEP